MKREDCDFTSALVDDVKGMRIGIPRDYLGECLEPEVKDAIRECNKAGELIYKKHKYDRVTVAAARYPD